MASSYFLLQSFHILFFSLPRLLCALTITFQLLFTADWTLTFLELCEVNVIIVRADVLLIHEHGHFISIENLFFLFSFIPGSLFILIIFPSGIIIKVYVILLVLWTLFFTIKLGAKNRLIILLFLYNVGQKRVTLVAVLIEKLKTRLFVEIKWVIH